MGQAAIVSLSKTGEAPTLLIVGCGYLGLELARRAAAAGWQVRGMRRSPDAAVLIAATGAQPFVGDIREPESLKNLPVSDFVCACLAPSREAESHESVYRQGAAGLIAALRSRPPKRLVWVSSTGVYGQTGGERVDEDTPPEPRTESGRVLLEAERLMLRSGLPVMLLRLAGVYGPGRTRSELLRSGNPAVLSPGYVNQVHRDDAAGMIRFLLERGRPGEVYLGADDTPVLRSEFYAWLSERTGIPLPGPDGAVRAGTRMGSKRCSNAKITALGYKLLYPSWRDGLESALSASE